MSFSARDWSNQFTACKRQIQSKRAQGEQFTAAELNGLVATLKTLDGQLRTMEASPLEYDIVASELSRRNVILRNLMCQLFGGSGAESSPASGGMAVGSGTVSASSSSSYNPLATSDSGLVMRQREQMRLQDEMLVDIEKGVGRMHEKAVAIGEEAKAHTRLLDELDGNVELATHGLQNEAQHASRVKDQSRVCYMYICIVVEFIILLLLVILAFAH